MASVKYELDSLMVLRILQAVLVVDLFSLGNQLERTGPVIMSGIELSFIVGLLALAEFGLFIIVLAMKPGWKFAVNLYAVFMSGVEIVWSIGLLLGLPYDFGYAQLPLLLILLRAGALIKLNDITKASFHVFTLD